MALKCLFICTMNERRSPTAEHIFAQMAGIEARSAVTVRRGGRAVTAELIAWADMIFPMEQRHLDRICERFSGAVLKGETVHVLDPPDEFQNMDGALVLRLMQKAAAIFG